MAGAATAGRKRRPFDGGACHRAHRARRAALAGLLPAAGLAQDRPPAGNEAAAKLKPIVAPAQPTPPDALPLGKLETAVRLPHRALCRRHRRRALAAGRPARHRVRRQPGAGKVFAIDGQRAVKVIASGLHRPNGLAISNGTLFIAEVSRISKIDDVEDTLDNPPSPVSVYDDLPKDQTNGLRFLGIGPDGKLYVSIGAALQQLRAASRLRRRSAASISTAPAWKWSRAACAIRSASTGRRRTSSFISPTTAATGCRRMRRATSSTASPRPGEEFRRAVLLPGQSARQRIRLGPFLRRVHRRRSCCSGRTRPRSACASTPAACFPQIISDTIFIARHGSWNSTKKLGGDVVAVHLNKSGSVRFDGAVPHRLPRRQQLISAARPTWKSMRDGSLLISDDWNGAVYRVTSGREVNREPASESPRTPAPAQFLFQLPLKRKKPGPVRGPVAVIAGVGCRQHLPEGNMLRTGLLWEDTHPAQQRA